MQEKPRRRGLRLTLRDLFWLTLVAALGLAWAVDHWRLSERSLIHEGQAATIQRHLQRHGQTVVFGNDGTVVVLDFPP